MKTTSENLLLAITAINILVSVPICCDLFRRAFTFMKSRRSRANAKELASEALRVELLSGGKRGEYALNVSPEGAKVATVREYNFAILTGVEDFWKHVPMFDGAEDCLATLELNADAGDGKSRVTCIFDGDSKTFTTQTVNIVPKNHVCTMATSEEVREAVGKAKSQAACGNAKRRQI